MLNRKATAPGDRARADRNSLSGHAADCRTFAEDVRLGAASERVSHYSLPGGR